MGDDDGDLAMDSMGADASNPILIINENASIAATGPDDSGVGGVIEVAFPVNATSAMLEFVM